MLETELIAMKLCKLKMEADKTEAELQVKEMEKTLTSLQNGHSSQVSRRHSACTVHQDAESIMQAPLYFHVCHAVPGAAGTKTGVMACLGL